MLTETDAGNSDSDDPDFLASEENYSSDDSINSENNEEIDEPNDISGILDKKKGIKVQSNKLSSRICSEDEQIASLLNKSDNDEKSKTDALWKNFLNDTTASSSKLDASQDSNTTSEDQGKKSIQINSSIFSKSGQSSTIKKISSNSSNIVESVLNNSKQDLTKASSHKSAVNKGLSQILSTVKKKSKLSTLEKSKLDWNQFKEEHCLEEEISSFNRGKSGYLEKQDFLKRTDSRQFEIEKELRNVKKRKQ